MTLCIIASYFLPSIILDIKGKKYNLDEVFFLSRWTIPAIGPILIGTLFAILNFSNWNGIQNKFKELKYGILSLLMFFSPLYLPDILMPLLNFFHGLGVVLVLLWIVNNQNNPIIKILEWHPIKYIGTISYGIYIWQGFFVRTDPNITPKVWVHEYPQNVLLSFLIAYISYELFEKKILTVKNKFKINAQ